jgi:hypothetical protein
MWCKQGAKPPEFLENRVDILRFEGRSLLLVLDASTEETIGQLLCCWGLKTFQMLM